MVACLRIADGERALQYVEFVESSMQAEPYPLGKIVADGTLAGPSAARGESHAPRSGRRGPATTREGGHASGARIRRQPRKQHVRLSIENRKQTGPLGRRVG